MIKKSLILTFFFCFFAMVASAQDVKQTSDVLGFYPNPVTSGKIFITSKTNLDKEIVIFDVLGKKIYQTTLSSSRELNISFIPTGVYIIKISEGDITATRKLIIR